MKRVLLMCCIISLCAGLVFAGGIDNKSNLSAGYIRQPSKNTESESPDAVFYNPAGTAFMEDGFYVEFDNQTVIKEYSHEMTEGTPAGLYDGEKYKNNNPIPVLPSAMFVYKKDKLAIFDGLGFVGGGGALYYKDGTMTTNAIAAQLYVDNGYNAAYLAIGTEQMNIDSYFLGETIGASYAVSDNLSVSLAGRIIFARSSKEVEGGYLDIKSSATGYGAIVGVHYKANEKIDLTFQYQTITKMEWEYDKAEGSLASSIGVVDGGKYDRDLPAMLALGVGSVVNDKLYANISFNYYFNSQATMETGLMGAEEKLDDSWEIATGAEYDLNEKLELSAGLMYTVQGFKDDENSYENPYNNSITIGLGGEYEAIENLKIQLGFLKAIYLEEEYEGSYGTAKVNKDVMEIAVGVSYKF